jgi:hypothetical protein
VFRSCGFYESGYDERLFSLDGLYSRRQHVVHESHCQVKMWEASWHGA